MRVWIDVSNSPQVPFFRPLVDLLHARGHDVDVTTREFAQTIELLSLHGIEHEVVGPGHGGAGAVGKARSMAGRLRALRRYARGQRFDIALSHASHELPMVARSLGVPSSYAFDYEFARTQHGLGCRTATRVVVPEAIPQSTPRPPRSSCVEGASLSRAEGGVLPPRIRSGPIRARRSRDRARAHARRRADAARGVAVPPARQSALRRRARAAREPIPRSTPSSCRARTSSERLSEDARCPHSSSPSTRSTPRASSRSRISSISAGGTMNREAVALGVPVYTTFAGELGAVDAMLVREGLLRRLARRRRARDREAPRRLGTPDSRSRAPARPHAHRPRAVAQSVSIWLRSSRSQSREGRE